MHLRVRLRGHPLLFHCGLIISQLDSNYSLNSEYFFLKSKKLDFQFRSTELAHGAYTLIRLTKPQSRADAAAADFMVLVKK